MATNTNNNGSTNMSSNGFEDIEVAAREQARIDAISKHRKPAAGPGMPGSTMRMVWDRAYSDEYRAINEKVFLRTQSLNSIALASVSTHVA